MSDMFFCGKHGLVRQVAAHRYHTVTPKVTVLVNCGCYAELLGGTEDRTYCLEHESVYIAHQGQFCGICGNHTSALLTCGCDGVLFLIEGVNVFRSIQAGVVIKSLHLNDNDNDYD